VADPDARASEPDIPAAPIAASRPSGPVLALRTAASAALAIGLLWFALPRVTGTRWSQIATVLGRLDTVDVLLLTAVWLAGLWSYTFVLTGSIPGLRHGQALTVNVTSSAASNLAPFGGALGLAVSLGMLRSWGFTAGAFALSAVVTGIWNVLAKLALPLLGLLALLLGRDVATGRLAGAAAVAAVVLAVAIALLAGTLSSERVAVSVGRALQRVGRLALRLARSERRPDWDRAVPRLRHRVIDLVRAGWVRLTLGLAGFLGSQALLLYLILRMLGSSLSPGQVFAGYAFGRLLSTLVITPGGLGIAETGAAGLLTALGGDPAVSASGVLLFSGFAFFAEFPAGAVGYLVWVTRRGWRRPPVS
jgi:uncharacterized membrane protein YbhN (UPF0104 family)